MTMPPTGSAPDLAALLAPAKPEPRPRISTPEEVRAFVASKPDPELLAGLYTHLLTMLGAMPKPLQVGDVSMLDLELSRALQANAGARPDADAASSMLQYAVADAYGFTAEVYAVARGELLPLTDARIEKVVAENGWTIVDRALVPLEWIETPPPETSPEGKARLAKLRTEIEAIKKDLARPTWHARRVK
ncbi:MAG: hypothetical protein JO257_06040 [Deltaproteobacteria bacterium]|nr:hypothetical protein [Deltaproteobacteria bacterium]